MSGRPDDSPLGASPVGEAKDPVRGMPVHPKWAARARHDGTEYLFCCDHCKAKFVAEPERYLEPPAPGF